MVERRGPTSPPFRLDVFKRSSGVCEICGAVDALEISHIVPTKHGGDESADNLMLVCARCNRSVGAREADFANYLTSVMTASKQFSLIKQEPLLRDKDGTYRPDMLAEELQAGVARTIIVECKAQTSISTDRISGTIQQILRYRAAANNSMLVLALPGRLPERAMELLAKNGIELWDGEYLSKRFAQEIAAQPHPFFTFAQHTQLSPHLQLLSDMQACPKGKANWGLYQQLVGRLLALCYCPPLRSPIGELLDHAGANRRDYILPNPAAEGFWQYIRTRYAADYVVVDAKNSAKMITKKDVLQIANYLKPQGTGSFALIFSRMGANSGAHHTLREQWLLGQKMIVVLDDSDVESILTDVSTGGPGTQVLEDLIQTFRLSI